MPAVRHKADLPMVHVYRTDFGDVRLTDEFVEEADRRWPDLRCTRTPRWVDKVHPAITRLVFKNPKITTLKSLRALAPYMEAA